MTSQVRHNLIFHVEPYITGFLSIGLTTTGAPVELVNVSGL